MNVTLPSEQVKWLEARVAAGEFSSIDEAVTLAVAELIALHNDDLAWAKPYVDKALAQVERGEVISGEEFFERLKTKRARRRSS